MATAESLAAVLLDPTARLDERDDAAIDLGEYDDAIALSALLIIARDQSADEMLQSSAGESIGYIWGRAGGFDQAAFDSLTSIARSELRGVLPAN